jgi:ABC-type sugar transport system permease subunit
VPGGSWPGTAIKHYGGAQVKTNNRTVRDAFAGYLFLLPAMIVFGFFIAEPLVASVVLSFSQYDVITPAKFIFLPWE